MITYRFIAVLLAALTSLNEYSLYDKDLTELLGPGIKATMLMLAVLKDKWASTRFRVKNDISFLKSGCFYSSLHFSS